MKHIKIMISVMLILAIALVSCKKDSTTGPTGGSIEGTWNVVDAYFGWLLTTNSNQVATNMFDVTGQINISGTHTVTLNDMWIDDTDPPSFFVFDFTDDDSNYFLLLDGTTGEGTFITNVTSQTFMGNVTFTYNNGTLTITQSTITDVASDATVTISGSLSFTQTNIPANTPTLITFSDDFDDIDEIGLTTLTFNNGTVTVTDVFEGVTDTETWTYTTNGNQLTVTDEFNETMTYEYSVTGSTLTLVATDFEDICEDYNSQAECFADMELLFSLTPGSLTAVSMRVEIILNQAAAKQGLNVGRTYNLINPTEVISDYKLKIDKLKKTL